MTDKQRTPVARSPRRVGPLLVAGLVVTLGLLVLGGCVSAGSSSGAAAPTGTPSRPAAVAPLPPSAVPAPSGPGSVGGGSGPCLSATNPGELCGGGPVVSPLPDAGNLPSAPAGLPTPTSVLVAPAAAPLVVTIADDGTTLHLAVGQQFLLDLGSSVDWTVKVADEQVVGRVTGVPVPVGDQGIYEASKPGTTVLSAVGSPHCTSGICPFFRLGFSVTITVS
jgi:hypothetical protein